MPPSVYSLSCQLPPLLTCSFLSLSFSLCLRQISSKPKSSSSFCFPQSPQPLYISSPFHSNEHSTHFQDTPHLQSSSFPLKCHKVSIFFLSSVRPFLLNIMEHKHMLILIILPTSLTALVVFLVLIYFCTRKRRETVSRDVEANFEVKERDGVEKDLLIKFQDGEDLTVYDILDAPGEVIGKSSYGTLYRATLLSIDRLTLLRFLRPACTVTMKEVVPVMELLGSLRHPSLVPLCAFYVGPRGEKLMVHPFYRHGTLAQLIRDGNGEAHKWHIICRISIGITQGLDYLHTDLEIPIIHGNLKSNNILLDRHFRPYVSDFGLHLLLNPTAGQEMLEASAAQGYKAPELIKMKEVSEETDIYSLGIILLELLTGKEPVYRKPNLDKDIYLPNAIQSAILDHRVADFYHPQILVSQTDGQKAVNEDLVYEFLQLAVACCSPSPALRPTIKQVLSKLEEIGR